MKKDFDFEKFEDEMTELGDTLGLSVSLVKTIDIISDDEINFEKQDMENLTVILKNLLEDAAVQYSKIEKLLCL